MSNVIANLIASIGADLNPLYNSMREAEAKMQESSNRMSRSLRQISETADKIGKDLSRVGGTLSRNLTLPIVALGTGAFKMQKDFESSMSKIVGLVGVARDQVDGWSQDILKMAPELGKSPKELADALFFVTSAGMRGAQAMDVLRISAKASAAGLGETKVVADLLTSAINAYGAENLNATQAADILVAAVREGKAEASELAAVMGQVLPIASEMGVSFDQVGAAIAAMTRTGTEATIASTQLRGILAALTKPTNDAKKALEEMGMSSEGLRRQMREEGLIHMLGTLREKTREFGEEAMGRVVPNIRAMMGVLDLMGMNAADNIAIFESLKDATGALDHAFDAASETAEFKWQKALASGKTALTAVGASVAEVVIPAMEKLSGWLARFAEWFTNLDDGIKRTLVTVLALVAALGPMLVILGKLFSLFGGLVKVVIAVRNAFLIARTAMVALNVAMAANPIGAIITLVGGLIAALALLGIQSRKTGDITTSVNAEAEKSVAKQRVEVEKLIRVAESEHATLEQRQRALQELNKISPEYFGNLELEKEGLNGAREAAEKYIESLLKKARIQAAEDMLVELEKERIQVLKDGSDAQLNFWQKLRVGMAGQISMGQAHAAAHRMSMRNREEAENQYLENRESLMNIIIDGEKELGEAMDDTTKSVDGTKKAVDDLTGSVAGLAGETERELGILEKLNEELKFWRDAEIQATSLTHIIESRKRQLEIEKEIKKYTALIDIMAGGPKRMTGIGIPTGPQLQEKTHKADPDILAALNEYQKGLREIHDMAEIFDMDPIQEQMRLLERTMEDMIRAGIDPSEEAIQGLKQTWEELALTQDDTTERMLANAQQLGMAMTGILEGLLSTTADAFAGMITGQKDFTDGMAMIVNFVGDSFQQLGKLFIAQGVAAKAFLQSLSNPYAAIAAGFALVAAGAAIKSFMAKGLEAPKLARGGRIPDGFPNDTYPAWLSSGEEVIPAPEARSANSFGSGESGELVARIERAGTDLLMYLSEEARRMR